MDVSVVEVGIGGAYDTTNVIRRPKVQTKSDLFFLIEFLFYPTTVLVHYTAIANDHGICIFFLSCFC